MYPARTRNLWLATSASAGASRAPTPVPAPTPIVYTITPAGFGETIVWDFRTPGEVTRHAWTANQPQDDWHARGTPAFTTEKYVAPNGQTGLHVRAVDDKGRLAIDQILLPRPHD